MDIWCVCLSASSTGHSADGTAGKVEGVGVRGGRSRGGGGVGWGGVRGGGRVGGGWRIARAYFPHVCACAQHSVCLRH